MNAAITVENLGKSYRVSHQQARAAYRTLRESIHEVAGVAWDRLRGRNRSVSTEEFWALDDLNFAVQPGEVVGIIGKNGAGKSTLLKILSRITAPTTGRAIIWGRIGSLLEVGTGFHPELTGRENIFLNGSVLGMSRREIERKFDEIVAFADVERFLDTPVKRYSSGMFVRLGFAVAAHLEPEILVVDEVLAVGDAGFQKRCLGKMKDVSREGRTVLFVSHNMATLEALCDRCILLEKGSLRSEGPTHEVIADYFRANSDGASGEVDLRRHRGRTKESLPLMTSLTLSSEGRRPVDCVRMGAELGVEVGFDLGDRALRPVLGVAVKSGHGHPLFGTNNRIIPGYDFDRCRSRGRITCVFESVPLMPGPYYLDLYFGDEHRDIDVVQEALSFEVVVSDVFGSGKIPPGSAGPFFLSASFMVEANELTGIS